MQHAIVSHREAYRELWPGQPALVVGDFGPLAALLVAGAGVGLLPDFVAARYLEQGLLLRLELEGDGLEGAVPTPTLSLLWLRSRHMAPRVRAFIDHTVSRASLVTWL